MNELVTFEQARADVMLRQQYLDSLLKQASDSVQAFVYDDGTKMEAQVHKLVDEGYIKAEELQPRLEAGRKADFQFVTPISSELIGSGKQSPIFVYDGAFNMYGVEELFLNCILDHEGKHVDDIKDGMQLRDGNVIDQDNIGLLQEVTQINLLEATAYRRQLDKAAGRGVQKEDYLSHINFIYQGIVGTLERISVKNDFERKAINSEIY